MIADVYKIYFKEINNKNRMCNYYFNHLIKAKKTKKKSNHKRTANISQFVSIEMIMENQ